MASTMVGWLLGVLYQTAHGDAHERMHTAYHHSKYQHHVKGIFSKFLIVTGQRPFQFDL